MKKKIVASNIPCDKADSFIPHITLARNTVLKNGKERPQNK